MSKITLPTGVNVAHPDRLFIGGKWEKANLGGEIEVVDPNTEQVVAIVAEASEADMDAAVRAARIAFDKGPWPRMKPTERVAKLRAMAKYLEGRQAELERAWTAQVGTLPATAGPITKQTTANLAGYADIGEKYEWVKTFHKSDSAVSLVVREAVGVVAAIAPWNAPYATMMNKVAPALLPGNCVIMKPSPETPLEAYIIAEAGEAVGLPPGVLQLLPSHREAADHLVCNPGVDKVSFTGSTVAGRRIASVCGSRIARVTLELGGKSATIIADDMPVAQAAKFLARTVTPLTGQVCALLSRAIVPAKMHDELAEGIAAEMKQVRIGNSMDQKTEMGPLAMKRQLERVEGYIAQGKADGNEVLSGGGRPSHLNNGYFFEPTLFGDVDNKSTIAQEEIFGPVLTLIKADDDEHAVDIANDTIYGLNGAVLSLDTKRAYEIARRMRTGNISQNGVRGPADLPFGGFKQSGLGRERGIEGLNPYIETKTIVLTEPLSGY